jgi:hypothetical protein
MTQTGDLAQAPNRTGRPTRPLEKNKTYQLSVILKRRATPIFPHFGFLQVDAAWPRLGRAFRTAPVSRQTIIQTRFVTNRAFPHALPPSPGLRSALCPVPGLFFLAAALVMKKTSRKRREREKQ